MPNHENEIVHLFRLGWKYKEIIHYIQEYYGVSMCLSTLKRRLRRQGLRRRKSKTPLLRVVRRINNEIQGPGRCSGYRTMHQTLQQDGYVVDRETVRIAIKALDPQGVEERSRHRLLRREYSSAGPDFLWHIDGHDKLKPYGFPIHGAIDGYSRRILWLNVGASNNDPAVVASYYLQYVKEMQRLPRCIRSDHGTENVNICGIQRYLRRGFNDDMSGENSFLFGPSTSNQRIEAWWSFLKKSRVIWWINLFKDLIDGGDLDVTIPAHLDCVKWCFTGVLQTELDKVKERWNNHVIRKCSSTNAPNGKPDVLYFLPSRSGGRHCAFPGNMAEIQMASSFVNSPSLLPCERDVAAFYGQQMANNHLSFPTNGNEAKELFLFLVNTR